jgi:hypothetical protein
MRLNLVKKYKKQYYVLCLSLKAIFKFCLLIIEADGQEYNTAFAVFPSYLVPNQSNE